MCVFCGILSAPAMALATIRCSIRSVVMFSDTPELSRDGHNGYLDNMTDEDQNTVTLKNAEAALPRITDPAGVLRVGRG
ncbi:uncharacterized protein EI90DRAFT_3111364, partial [Cantharellus anzutake]|uniref:uncharacterized protein n=1 Tax=Cantharellus anzutake TaxID=1750568 RepID=UPI001908AF56